ncbi:MAG TPA: Ig-like domain-containing protein [candidate division Zixibacteria bacterium]|nr:Ig-like domain-containing protein [candidate division Zixibacteria bacterium]
MAKLREVNVLFPILGENRRGVYAQETAPFTSPYSENIRSFDSIERRGRGGSRLPLKKWISTDMGASITAMERLSYQDGSGDHQEDLVVIVDGNLKIIQGSSVTTSVSNLEAEDGTLITDEAGVQITFESTVAAINTVTGTGGYNMVQYGGKMFIAGDYCYRYDPNAGTIEIVANAPVGQPLVEVYRHCLALAGEDHIFYISEQGNFSKWSFFDLSRGAKRAIVGTPTDDGKLGGDCTCIKSWGNDALIVATKDSIWAIVGNPNTSGRLESVSREIGIIAQGAISITADGFVLFVARSGVYSWQIGSNAAPKKFSEKIVPEELKDIDTDANVVKMQYDEKANGIRLFVTPTAATVGTHWFFDLETKAFWRTKYQQTHQPLALAVMPIAGDSNVIMGCKDGYLRRHDSTSTTDDDGSDLNSHLLIGPFKLGGGGGHDGMIQKIFAALADGSEDVTWAIVTADSGEEAVDNAVTDIQAGTTVNVVATGTWEENFNSYRHPRSRGAYAVLWLSCTSNWGYETLGFIKKSLGKMRVV